jgi:hypothetical protein
MKISQQNMVKAKSTEQVEKPRAPNNAPKSWRARTLHRSPYKAGLPLSSTGGGDSGGD